MKNIYTILIIAGLGLSACGLLNNNVKPELPPITMEGKNTFGCLINGKLFLPKAPWGQGTGVQAHVHKDNNLTSVNIYADNTNQSFFISIIDKPELQIDYLYNLNDTIQCAIQFIKWGDGSTCDYEKVISGHVKLIKFNIATTQKKIIAGTFEFKAYSDKCNDTITVTQGRFDIGDILQ